MRWVVLLVLAGCGRIGFDSAARADAAGDAFEIPDLVVVYPMDDLPSGLVPASVAAYAGSCVACPTVVAGHVGGAYQFDGASRILLPTMSSQLATTGAYTVALWVEAGPQTADMAMVAKPYSPAAASDVIAVTIGNDDGAAYYETTPDGTAADFTDSTTVLAGGWHHVAVTWNGADTKAIYVDGAMQNSTAATVQTSDQPLSIGADLDGGTAINYFTGALDELQFYARALAPGEIAMLAEQ